MCKYARDRRIFSLQHSITTECKGRNLEEVTTNKMDQQAGNGHRVVCINELGIIKVIHIYVYIYLREKLNKTFFQVHSAISKLIISSVATLSSYICHTIVAIISPRAIYSTMSVLRILILISKHIWSWTAELYSVSDKDPYWWTPEWYFINIKHFLGKR